MHGDEPSILVLSSAILSENGNRKLYFSAIYGDCKFLLQGDGIRLSEKRTYGESEVGVFGKCFILFYIECSRQKFSSDK